MVSLIRDRDGEGYSGCLVQALDFDGKTPGGKVVGDKPMVGYCLKVGTMTAGTYSDRDWRMTTPITEIISETEEEVKFKTGNSTYTFRNGPSLIIDKKEGSED